MIPEEREQQPGKWAISFGYLQNAREEVKNDGPCPQTVVDEGEDEDDEDRDEEKEIEDTSLSSGCQRAGTRPRDFSSRRHGNSVQRFSISAKQASVSGPRRHRG